MTGSKSRQVAGRRGQHVYIFDKNFSVALSHVLSSSGLVLCPFGPCAKGSIELPFLHDAMHSGHLVPRDNAVISRKVKPGAGFCAEAPWSQRSRTVTPLLGSLSEHPPLSITPSSFLTRLLISRMDHFSGFGVWLWQPPPLRRSPILRRPLGHIPFGNSRSPAWGSKEPLAGSGRSRAGRGQGQRPLLR